MPWTTIKSLSHLVKWLIVAVHFTKYKVLGSQVTITFTSCRANNQLSTTDCTNWSEMRLRLRPVDAQTKPTVPIPYVFLPQPDTNSHSNQFCWQIRRSMFVLILTAAINQGISYISNWRPLTHQYRQTHMWWPGQSDDDKKIITHMFVYNWHAKYQS